MKRQDRLTILIQHYNVIDYFNYNYAIEWAMNLLEKGNNHEAVLMLASFAEPIDSFEIRPYIQNALKATGLDEKNNLDDAIKSYAAIFIFEISNKVNIKNNLSRLKNLYNDYNFDYDLQPFYLLHYEWMDIEFEEIYGHYYPDVTLDTIEAAAIKEAKLWLQNNPNPEQ